MTIQRLFNYWIGKKRSGFYLFLESVFAGMYFVGAMIGSDSPSGFPVMMEQAGFFGFLAGIVAFLIHLNLYAGRGFLKHFEYVDHLPKKQIWSVNSFCMSMFLMLCLVLLPAAAFGLEPLWEAVGRWFTERTHLEEAVYPALHMELEPMGTPDMEALFGEARPTPAWLKLLDHLFRILGVVFIVLMILLIIQIFCRRLWAWITKPRQFDDDEKIYLTPALSIFPKKKTEPKKPLLHNFLSYNERIRRQYRREILTCMKKKKLSPLPSASPMELEQAAGLEHKTLHQLYEKARYGKEECTRDDWNRLSG